MEQSKGNDFHDGLSEDLNAKPVIPTIFKIKTANQWIADAMSRPKIESLWMGIWHEEEICVLFSDMNCGKSILAVQIANDISRTQPVLFLDFELSDMQFQHRYTNSDRTAVFQFSDNFIRAEVDPKKYDFEDAGFSSVEDFIKKSIEQAIIENKVKIVILDNITFLGNENEKARNALPLMKEIITLQQKYNLSILLLAHSPKRPQDRPITQNDLAGSKTFMNFIDSCFAINYSNMGENFRYLKQIKSRQDQIIFHSENVVVFQIVKQDGIFLMFNPVHDVHPRSEHEHLMKVSRDERKDRVKEKHEKGLTFRQISREEGISLGTIYKMIHEDAEDIQILPG